jgi:hypothetical protein
MDSNGKSLNIYFELLVVNVFITGRFMDYADLLDRSLQPFAGTVTE